MKVTDLDFVFISYDEPNAEINFADISNKVPWVKRVHGVKGSDAAHKAAADLADTDWFVTIDGDNQIYESFLKLELSDNPDIKVYSWCGRNVINGLLYGNGGIKIWNKDFVKAMRTHEDAESPEAQIDFCWENGYKNFPRVFSDSIINETPYQAWRAGFREGVKMLTKKGVRVEPKNIRTEVYWHNLHRLRIWSCVGSHSKNGIYSMLGARQGSLMLHDSDWNYYDVRDFEKLREIYDAIAFKFETNPSECILEIKNLGLEIKSKLGLTWTYFDSEQSSYVVDLYSESLELGKTYFSEK